MKLRGLLLIWRGDVEVRKTKAGDFSGFGFACLFIGVISVLIALSAIGSIRTPEAWALQEVLRIFGR